MSNYIGCFFEFSKNPEIGEALVGELGMNGFESFVEEEGALEMDSLTMNSISNLRMK